MWIHQDKIRKTSNILCSLGRQLLGDVTPAKAFGTYYEAVDRAELVWLRCWIILGHSGASVVSGNLWIEVTMPPSLSPGLSA